jgi:transposase
MADRRSQRKNGYQRTFTLRERCGCSPNIFYRRLCGRMDMDKPRANTAVAHKLARMVYFMLTCGEAYVDQGQQHYEEQQRQRSIAALKRRAAALGFNITPTLTSA